MQCSPSWTEGVARTAKPPIFRRTYGPMWDEPRRLTPSLSTRFSRVPAEVSGSWRHRGGTAASADGVPAARRGISSSPIFASCSGDAAFRSTASGATAFIRDVAAAISPDGHTVAFIRVASGGVSDIYLVPFVGGEPGRLTSNEAWLERVAWARPRKSSHRRGTRAASNSRRMGAGSSSTQTARESTKCGCAMRVGATRFN